MKRIKLVAVLALWAVALPSSSSANEGKPLLDMAWFAYQTAPQGGMPSESLLLFGGKGTDLLGVYGFNKPHPFIEWDHYVWRSRAFGSTGGFLLATSNGGRALELGLTQNLALPLPGSGRLGGFFSVWHPGNCLQLTAPNLSTLWPTGKSTRLGLGANLSLTEGAKTALLLGPMVELKTKLADRPMSYRVRVGHNLLGTRKGDWQFRLDTFMVF